MQYPRLDYNLYPWGHFTKSSHMPSEAWDEIAHPFPPHLMMDAITYPAWD